MNGEPIKIDLTQGESHKERKAMVLPVILYIEYEETVYENPQFVNFGIGLQDIKDWVKYGRLELQELALDWLTHNGNHVLKVKVKK